MNSLPASYSSHGHTYQLINSFGLAAIYQMTVNGLPFQYEVIRFRWRPAGMFRGKEIPAGWRMPSDQDWGRYGKTVMVPPGAQAAAKRRADEIMEAWSRSGAKTPASA